MWHLQRQLCTPKLFHHALSIDLYHYYKDNCFNSMYVNYKYWCLCWCYSTGQKLSVASLNSRFLREWRIENKLLRIALWIEPHKTRQNTTDSPMTDFSIILHAYWHNTKWQKMAWFIPASTAVCFNFVRSEQDQVEQIL